MPTQRAAKQFTGRSSREAFGWVRLFHGRTRPSGAGLATPCHRDAPQSVARRCEPCLVEPRHGTAQQITGRSSREAFGWESVPRWANWGAAMHAESRHGSPPRGDALQRMPRRGSPEQFTGRYSREAFGWDSLASCSAAHFIPSHSHATHSVANPSVPGQSFARQGKPKVVRLGRRLGGYVRCSSFY